MAWSDRRRRCRALLPTAVAVSAAVAISAGCGERPGAGEPAGSAPMPDLRAERAALDETVWADEVAAARYEETVIELWDSIRTADDKLAALAAFELGSITLPEPAREFGEIDLGVGVARLEPGAAVDAAGWRAAVQGFADAGWKLVQSDWHHGRFVPGGRGGVAPRSEIDFNLHAIHPATRTAVMVEGLAEVTWDAPPRVAVVEAKLKRRAGGGFFRKVLTAEGRDGEFATAHPVLVYDLDGDGLSEVALPRWNRVYRNRGGWNLEEGPLLAQPVPLEESALFSDFDGDGLVDLLAVRKGGGLVLYRGAAGGAFDAAPVPSAGGITFEGPSALTAGDADGDGDLDVWATQYKLAYAGGQMPTPYFDANDGWPSYFLVNDGSGQFRDATAEAGLDRLRHRRTYAASFVDFDGDRDLDLVNVADYAGVDLYRNDGAGGYTEVTGELVDNSHTFGMGLAVADFDADLRADLFVVGMSSTTARRLDRLGLGRDDRPEVGAMRAAMGFGNRLYFGGSDGRFRESPGAAAGVARTGWSWGVVAPDIDLDGDRDLYVANGYRSGKSTRDYCTTYWRHDLYTGTSQSDPRVASLFRDALAPLNSGEMSWNGYEKNHLLVNVRGGGGGHQFEDLGFLVGLGLGFDARALASDDLDGDGRPDLVVSEAWWDGRGWVTATHIYRNELELPPGRRWAGLRLREPGGGRSPNGAVVDLVFEGGGKRRWWVVSGDSYAAQQPAAAHFGIPEGEEPSHFEVTWPDGTAERVQAVAGEWRVVD